MCGIVGYIGKQEAFQVLLRGLQRLEYRGYDSAGIAVLNRALSVVKQKGNVASLRDIVGESNGKLSGATLSIGHIRWATHGDPSDRKAHPHLNAEKDIALIHNGIIENYAAFRIELAKHGYSFSSDTDSEVLVHLVDHLWKSIPLLDFEGAVRQALTVVEGAYGICVISSREPDVMIVARKGSPLVIGIGDGEYFIASDAAPLVEYTRKVVYLADGEMAVIRRDGYKVKTIDNDELEKALTELDFELEEARIRLSGIADQFEQFRQAQRIIICACGMSWHAGLIGEYLIEEFANIPVEVDYASEFRYRKPIIGPGDVMLVISQLGETADTLAALRMAKEKGAMVIGICNVVGSTIARETNCGIYTHAGPEIGVASNKAFTAQVIVLTMFALALSKDRTMSDAEIMQALQCLTTLPERVKRILENNKQIMAIADHYKEARNFLYLGRGYNFPVVLEGALKLKEISYIHAEGYPAAEMKHGPIALIDEDMPVVLIAIASEGDEEIQHLADHVIYVPEGMPYIILLLTVILLQLLSYYNCNVV